MKIGIIIGIMLILVISGCTTRTATTTTTTVATSTPTTAVVMSSIEPSPLGDETSCTDDIDCACGVHIETGDCFLGNSAYVDVSQQCPDFCTGFGGNLMVKCVSSKCVQLQIAL